MRRYRRVYRPMHQSKRRLLVMTSKRELERQAKREQKATATKQKADQAIKDKARQAENKLKSSNLRLKKAQAAQNKREQREQAKQNKVIATEQAVIFSDIVIKLGLDNQKTIPLDLIKKSYIKISDAITANDIKIKQWFSFKSFTKYRAVYGPDSVEYKSLAFDNKSIYDKIKILLPMLERHHPVAALSVHEIKKRFEFIQNGE